MKKFFVKTHFHDYSNLKIAKTRHAATKNQILAKHA